MKTLTMNWKKMMITGVLAIGVVALLGGCGSQGGDQAQKGNTLKVGTNATFVPFEFKKEGSEELQGFDIEVATEIAKRTGKTIEFKNVPFDALVPALDNGEIDLAASGMTITKARMEKVGFSMPYYESGMAVVVKETSSIKGLNDLSGKTIAVQMGTTGADLASKINGAIVKNFDHTSDALLELNNGGVEGALIDLPVAQYYAANHADQHLQVIAYPNTKEYFGLAMNKKNKDLIESVNKALTEMKQDGTLNKMYQKWFKTDMPSDMPVTYEGK